MSDIVAFRSELERNVCRILWHGRLARCDRFHGRDARATFTQRNHVPAAHKSITLLLLLLFMPVVVVIATALGPTRIHSLSIFFDTTFGIHLYDWQPWEQVILFQVRLPRVLVGALVGGGLALAGAVMQGVFRNPMADPGGIGISGGASLGAVIAIALHWHIAWTLALPVSAFVVACACAFLVYIISTVRGKTSVLTLLLAGIAVGGIASSLTSFVLTLSLSSWDVGKQIVYWLMGGLNGKTWTDVALSGPIILGGSCLLLIYARDLNVLTTGEEVAQSLGINVNRTRREILILATAVTATAVSVSGTLVFVGLLVPHILRLILGPEHRLLMIASFLGGAIFLVLADLMARTVIAPDEMRLGVLTSLLGGPFFLFLLITHRLRVEPI